MALNKEYFDSIHIDVVKKKYYNANKVNAVFEDIRKQAEQLSEENEQMRAQLETLNDKKFEIGDAILTAQTVYKELVQKAQARAEAIVKEAETEKEKIISEALEQQEYAVQRVEHCCSKLKEQHMASIEAINAELQDFLCGLYPDEDEQPRKTEAVSASKLQSAANSNVSEKDIADKIRDIANELFSDK